MQQLTRRIILVLWVALPGAFASCREPEVKTDPAGNTVALFAEPGGLFQALIPEGFNRLVQAGETSGVYQFQKLGEQGEVLRQIRFRIESPLEGKTADLFSPGYEARFLEDCTCSILERGVVNFSGSPSRQFIVSREGGSLIAFHRHVVIKNQYVRIIVEGKATDRDVLRKRFDDLLAGFTPAAKGGAN